MFRKIAMVTWAMFLALSLGCGRDSVAEGVADEAPESAPVEAEYAEDVLEANEGEPSEEFAADAAPAGAAVRIAAAMAPVEVLPVRPAEPSEPAEPGAPSPPEPEAEPAVLLASSEPVPVSCPAEPAAVSNRTEPAAPSAADTPLDPYVAFARAVELLDSGETGEAGSVLNGLLGEFTGDVTARAKVRTHLARLCLVQANHDERAGGDPSIRLREAHRLVTGAISIHPEASDAWNVRGRVLLMSKRPVEAYQAFRNALALDPDNGAAHNNLGYALILGSDFREAEQHLEDAVDAYVRSGRTVPPHVYNNLGVARERLGHLVEARDAYAEAHNGGHLTAGMSLARVESHLAYRPTRVVDTAEPDSGVTPTETASSF